MISSTPVQDFASASVVLHFCHVKASKVLESFFFSTFEFFCQNNENTIAYISKYLFNKLGKHVYIEYYFNSKSTIPILTCDGAVAARAPCEP